RGRRPGAAGDGERLLDVDDTQDGVGVVGADGEAGQPGAPGVGDEVGQGVVGGQRDDPGARGHEVLGDAVGEAQGAVHEGGGGGVEGAAAAAGPDEGTELTGGAGPAQFLGGFDAQPAHDRVRAAVEGI